MTVGKGTVGPVESAALFDGRKERRHSSTANTGRLFLEQEENSVKYGRQPLSPMRKSIDPALKAWVDNVIVPALVEKWNNGRCSARAGR